MHSLRWKEVSQNCLPPKEGRHGHIVIQLLVMLLPRSLAENPELLDIYLQGTKIEKLIREVVVGDAEVEGAKVRVSERRYTDLANRLNRELEIDRICRFVGSRCGRSFLEFYFKAC